MRDDDCVRFLQWALPRLGMRWPGFRKVRGQVCKRIGRRMAELGVRSLGEYRERLEAAGPRRLKRPVSAPAGRAEGPTLPVSAPAGVGGMDGRDVASEPDEWRELDRMCGITISRFWRDPGTFRALEETVLPALAEAAVLAGREHLDAWSCGCASGEEPYTLAILWHERLRPRFPELGPEPGLRVLATDLDLHLLRRAGRAVYPAGAVRDLPEELAEVALEPALDGGGDELRVADRYRPYVHRVRHDVREPPPAGPFHLVLCRNLAFTYFDEDVQRQVAARLVEALRPGGALVLGSHEEVPGGLPGLRPWLPEVSIYRRVRWERPFGPYSGRHIT